MIYFLVEYYSRNECSTSFFDGNLVCNQIIYYISSYLLNTIY